MGLTRRVGLACAGGDVLDVMQSRFSRYSGLLVFLALVALTALVGCDASSPGRSMQRCTSPTGRRPIGCSRRCGRRSTS